MIKRIIRRMLSMCPEAWYIFIRCIQLTAFLLLCSLVLLIGAEGQHELKMTSAALYEIGQAVLLVGALFSVIVEDFYISRR